MSKTAAMWTTRDGRTVAIRDMSDDHLVNIGRMLLRNAVSLQLDELERGSRLLCFVHGEMAQDAIESELDILSDTPPDDFVRQRWRHIFNEIRRRGLKL